MGLQEIPEIQPIRDLDQVAICCDHVTKFYYILLIIRNSW